MSLGELGGVPVETGGDRAIVLHARDTSGERGGDQQGDSEAPEHGQQPGPPTTLLLPLPQASPQRSMVGPLRAQQAEAEFVVFGRLGMGGVPQPGFVFPINQFLPLSRGTGPQPRRRVTPPLRIFHRDVIPAGAGVFELGERLGIVGRDSRRLECLPGPLPRLHAHQVFATANHRSPQVGDRLVTIGGKGREGPAGNFHQLFRPQPLHAVEIGLADIIDGDQLGPPAVGQWRRAGIVGLFSPGGVAIQQFPQDAPQQVDVESHIEAADIVEPFRGHVAVGAEARAGVESHGQPAVGQRNRRPPV